MNRVILNWNILQFLDSTPNCLAEVGGSEEALGKRAALLHVHHVALGKALCSLWSQNPTDLKAPL